MITQQLASQVIIDILNNEMDMPQNAVWLRQQNRTIPNDNGLYIAVGLVSAQTIGNVTTMETISNEQCEVNQVMQQEAIQIDLLSSAESNQAMLRNWEVVAALQGFYSQQLQELNNFKIFRVPRSFIDTSSAEGGSMLQRYSITIMAFVWYRKQTLLNPPLGDYYDDFTQQVSDDQTGELFSFEINADTPPPP
jgi:hypothetical protein